MLSMYKIIAKDNYILKYLLSDDGEGVLVVIVSNVFILN